MTDLKTCPFCNQLPAMNRSTRQKPNSYFVECASIDCKMMEIRTHRCGDEESAIQVWNTRHGN